MRFLGGAVFLFYDDAAASADGNIFAINNDSGLSAFRYPMMVDSQLNLVSQLGIGPLFSTTNMPGMALQDTGSLLYSSTNWGVDIIDVHHGQRAERILLNERGGVHLSGSIAVDETGQRIFFITNSGLTVVDLDSVPLSIGSVAPTQAGIGNTVTIRGSGFQVGTTVSIGSTTATVTFVDPNTLQVAVPSISSGSVPIKLSSPKGDSYELEGVFKVQ